MTYQCHHHAGGNHGAHHDYVAVGKVDQADDAVDHGVAQRHQRIHAASGQAVDDLLEKDVHDGRALRRGQMEKASALAAHAETQTDQPFAHRQ